MRRTHTICGCTLPTLRQKLGDSDPENRIIRAESGLGYRIVADGARVALVPFYWAGKNSGALSAAAGKYIFS